MITEIDISELKATLDGGARLVDVREEEELEGGTIPGFVHLPLSTFDEAEAELRKLGPKIVLYCRSGKRSLRAAQMAEQWGIGPHLYSLKGGFLAYQELNGG